MSGAVSTVAKPQLRGLLKVQIRNTFIIGTVAAAVGGILFKTCIADPRKEAYVRFYKTYDINKDFETKRAKGLFDSC